MILNFKEKPYIKCGNRKIKLEQGDYILDNTVCKQYLNIFIQEAYVGLHIEFQRKN